MQNVRIRSFILASAAFLLILSPVSPASAQSPSTFLVQLGEHETREAARAQWDDLQKRHPEVLGRLKLHIAPVRFGDEKETYRTQASGVSSYQQAESVCNALGNGDIRCSVVETSLFAVDQDNTAPAAPAAEIAAATPAAPAQLPSLSSLKSDEAESGTTEQPAGGVAVLPATEPLAAQATTAANAPATTDVPPAATNPAANSFSSRYLPWLGFGNASNATPEAAVEEEIAAWQQEQAKPAGAPERAEAAAAAQSLAATKPAQQEVVAERPRPQRLDQQSAQAAAAPAAPAVASTYTAPSAIAETYGQVPFPPATSSAPPSAASPAVAPVIPPVAEPGQAVAVPIRPQNEPTATANNVQAEVEVAEAVQVPLTFDGKPAPKLVNKPAGYGGFPSQPAPRGTAWLQLGYFVDKDAALTFSRELTRLYPDVMQLTRVRIVSPFAANRGLKQKAAMRVGPFRSDSEAQAVCKYAQSNGLNCSQVQELHNSTTTAANAERSRYNGPREQYGRREAVARGYGNTAGNAPGGAYWVQLGAFDNAAAAQHYWQQLTSTHGDVLARLRPQVSYPALSSSPAPVYHLRTGPFVNQVPALDLCGTLRARNLSCVIIQGR